MNKANDTSLNSSALLQKFCRYMRIDICISLKYFQESYLSFFTSIFYSYSFLQYVSMLQIPFNGKVVSNYSGGIMREYLTDGQQTNVTQG